MKGLVRWGLLAMVACAHPGRTPTRQPTDVPLEQLTRALGEAAWDDTRLHLATDRPLYRPGDTVWVRAWSVTGAALTAPEDSLGPAGLMLQLRNPRDQVVHTALLPEQGTGAFASVQLPEGAPGGVWTLRVVTHDGASRDREVVVVPFESPALLGDIEFEGEGYSAGDSIDAMVSHRRPTGEPVAKREVEATLLTGGRSVATAVLRTRADGTLRVSLPLPQEMTEPAALLSIADGQGGSVVRPVPVLDGAPRVAVFPEGGDLVVGLTSRVYLEAIDRTGDPVDVRGRLVDGTGQTLQRFQARNGRAAVSLTPQPSERYHVVVDAPTSVEVALPPARPRGCVLRAHSDADARQPLHAQVTCTHTQEVLLVASLRGAILDTTRLQLRAGQPHTAPLVPASAALASAQGVVRVTVFDTELHGLAERLVYRNRGRDLDIDVTVPDDAIPGQQVAMHVRTTGPDGRPVPADVSLMVVDDTWIAPADDDARDIRSALLLEPEVGPVDDPADYLDREDPHSAEDLDRLLATRGWRRFRQPERSDPSVPVDPASLPTPTLIDAPVTRTAEVPAAPAEERVVSAQRSPVDVASTSTSTVLTKQFLERIPAGRSFQTAVVVPPRAMMGPAPDGALLGRTISPGASQDTARPDYRGLDEARIRRAEGRLIRCVSREQGRTPGVGGRYRLRLQVSDSGAVTTAHAVGLDAEHEGVSQCLARQLRALRFSRGSQRRIDQQIALGVSTSTAAPVRFATPREFPPPPPFTPGVRNDLRATVAFVPHLRTDADGQATASFVTSDAITGFRVIVEGLGAAHVGRTEEVVASRPPLSATARTPAVLLSGDRVSLPVVLDNASPEPLTVALGLELQGGLQATDSPEPVRVPARDQVTTWLPLQATRPGEASLRLVARGGSYTDALDRTLTVAPRGFPRVEGGTVTLDGDVTRVALDLRGALPDSLSAEVQLAPGPAGLMEGLEGLVRQPHGCFEQTSATSYPNLLVYRYLLQSGTDPATLRQVRETVRQGADRLMTFETKSGGFEWFGRAPGHVALTSYGLLQFVQLKRTLPSLHPTVVDRIADWLLQRRDGTGGFRATKQRALHSWDQDPLLADLYATWALVEAGRAEELATELGRLEALVADHDDPYVLAVATLASSGPRRATAQLGAQRLLALRRSDGSLPAPANTITHSGERDATVETTALAVRAFEALGHHDAADAGRRWLAAQRRPGGTWGATQATVLALEALQGWPKAPSAPIRVTLDGTPSRPLAFPQGLTPARLPLAVTPTLRRVSLVGEAGSTATVSARFTTEALPESTGPLTLEVTVADGPHQAGDAVRLTAVIHNTSDQAVPTPVARIGIPAGLSVAPWQLRELLDRGVAAFLEVEDGAVIAYWDGLEPDQEVAVPLDLQAELVGHTKGLASSAWPYYDPDARTWAHGVEVEVARPSAP
ncbi:MAG: hypothetical protein KTR31_03995 [Myxococcales bacterium]|nr:hypothetical protein [Myxococcales bacterium]